MLFTCVRVCFYNIMSILTMRTSLHCILLIDKITLHYSKCAVFNYIIYYVWKLQIVNRLSTQLSLINKQDSTEQYNTHAHNI